MKAKVFFTGSPICSECGRFLQPEVGRARSGVPTGKLILRGHEPSCNLFGLTSTVALPSSEVIDVYRESAAAD